MVAGGAHLSTEPAGERRAVPVKMWKTPQRPPNRPGNSRGGFFCKIMPRQLSGLFCSNIIIFNVAKCQLVAIIVAGIVFNAERYPLQISRFIFYITDCYNFQNCRKPRKF